LGRKAQGPDFASEWGFAANACRSRMVVIVAIGALRLYPMDRDGLPLQIRHRGKPIRNVPAPQMAPQTCGGFHVGQLWHLLKFRFA
jgi:hypothetical protein